MAYPKKTIKNPLTGQEIQFLQTSASTNGALLEMESTYKPGSVEPPMHYHPAQTEHFTILDGEMTVRMNGSTRVLKAGDTLVVHPGMHHAMWNHSARPATINWQVRPALNMEHFFETLVGLSADGKTKPNGMPGLLQISLLMRRYGAVIRMVKPPYAIQRLVFAILSPVARLRGFQSSYDKYLD